MNHRKTPRPLTRPSFWRSIVEWIHGDLMWFGLLFHTSVAGISFAALLSSERKKFPRMVFKAAEQLDALVAETELTVDEVILGSLYLLKFQIWLPDGFSVFLNSCGRVTLRSCVQVLQMWCMQRWRRWPRVSALGSKLHSWAAHSYRLGLLFLGSFHTDVQNTSLEMYTAGHFHTYVHWTWNSAHFDTNAWTM